MSDIKKIKLYSDHRAEQYKLRIEWLEQIAATGLSMNKAANQLGLDPSSLSRMFADFGVKHDGVKKDGRGLIRKPRKKPRERRAEHKVLVPAPLKVARDSIKPLTQEERTLRELKRRAKALVNEGYNESQAMMAAAANIKRDLEAGKWA